MIIHNFIFGPMLSMEKSAYSWWNSKRKEYNIKLLLCFVAAQFLFMLVAVSSTGFADVDIAQRFIRMLIADLFIFLLMNIVYFLWPTLEVIFFRKINVLYRKYCFAFLKVLMGRIQPRSA